MKQIILLFSLLLPVILKAQSDFKSGYIIRETGDTIYGEIDYRGDLFMGKYCRFKPEGEDKIIVYTPDDIIAYRFFDNKYFVSKEVENDQLFLEYLIEGEISIFYMRDETGDHYYLEKENEKITELPYEKDNIIEKNGKKYIYHSSKHIGILKHYFKDAPELTKHIESLKKPEHRNLIKLAEDYHNLVNKEEPCNLYEKKIPMLKFNIDAAGGIMNFVNVNEDIKDKNYYQGGLLFHIWLPGINEKLYFKTGFLYSEFKYESDSGAIKSSYIVKIPLHIEYIAPKSYTIRPVGSVGLMAPSYSFGVMIRLNKRINLGIQNWYEFTTNKGIPWLPSQLIYYSFLTNIYIEL